MLTSFIIMIVGITQTIVDILNKTYTPPSFAHQGNIVAVLGFNGLVYFIIGVIAAAVSLNAIPIALHSLIDPIVGWELLTTVVHYMAYAPTYMHIFLIYAFCRIDDLSWGTKGLQDYGTEVEARDKFGEEKFHHVIEWTFKNVVLAFLLYTIV